MPEILDVVTLTALVILNCVQYDWIALLPLAHTSRGVLCYAIVSCALSGMASSCL